MVETEEDIYSALVDLVYELNATNFKSAYIAEYNRPQLPKGTITKENLAKVIGALLEENTIVVDESVTTGRDFFPFTAGAPKHDWLNNRGGSIGYGMPVAIGASVAAPDRKVLLLEGDGSGMYTVQSLWTMARENLNIIILIFANRSYEILKGELNNVGVNNPGPRAIDMLTLDRPFIDWVSLGRGMGINSVKVDDCETLARSIKVAFKENGPFLIEVIM